MVHLQSSTGRWCVTGALCACGGLIALHKVSQRVVQGNGTHAALCACCKSRKRNAQLTAAQLDALGEVMIVAHGLSAKF